MSEDSEFEVVERPYAALQRELEALFPKSWTEQALRLHFQMGASGEILIRVLHSQGAFLVEPEEGDTAQELANFIEITLEDMRFANDYAKGDKLKERVAALEDKVERLSKRCR